MVTEDRFSRQSFLGEMSQERIAAVTIGIAGLGGGGSHAVQQLAHVGFLNYVIADGDTVEDSNLNRLIAGTVVDALAESPKLLVARRTIFGLQPGAIVRGVRGDWQTEADSFKACQIIIGCVDSYRTRHELEVFCRRYLIDYIDIGMDVHGTDPPVIGGQVIQSSPGGPCMRCMGFLTDDKLAVEANRYGNAGARPQVVWPNGVLASTAVGIAVELVTNWSRKTKDHQYLVYDGTTGRVFPSASLRAVNDGPCEHFPPDQVGDPIFTAL